MAGALPVDYRKYLNDIIQEQSSRIADLEILLKMKSSNENKTCLLNKYYMDRLQRQFFDGKPKKLKLLPKPQKLMSMKSKQDRLSIIKSRTKTSKKVKITKTLRSEQFWILNPSDNIKQIRKEITILRKKHGIEKYNKHIKMYYYNYIK